MPILGEAMAKVRNAVVMLEIYEVRPITGIGRGGETYISRVKMKTIFILFIIILSFGQLAVAAEKVVQLEVSGCRS